MTTAEPSILKIVQNVSALQIQAAQNGLTGQTLAKQGDVVGRVDDGLGGTVPVVATKDLTAHAASPASAAPSPWTRPSSATRPRPVPRSAC